MSTLSGITGSSSSWAQTSANRSQMQAKMFAKVDADSSGGVNQTELQGLLDNVASKTGVTNSTKTSELFSKIDGNGDGSLSSDELASGMANILPPPSTMDFAQSRSSQSSDISGAERFAKLDADGSGTLSKDEMLDLMTQKASQGPGPGQTTAASTDEMFSKLDSNGDGSLTQAEFNAGAPEAQGRNGNSGDGGVRGVGGPPPPPPPGGGGKAESISSSTTYDTLDLNQDGTVSESERLIGELTKAATNSSDSTGSDSSLDVAKLAKTLYDKIASNWAQTSHESSLSVTA